MFHIGVKDIVDIILVTILLFEGYILLKKSGVASIFWGIFAFCFVWWLFSGLLDLPLMGAIFDKIISVGAIGLIVIFQDEIRIFFSKIGSRFSDRIHTKKGIKKTDIVEQIVDACSHMSESKTGALIVIEQKDDLGIYKQSGERLNAIVSSRLIENIFFKNTPLHDGALLICNNKIDSAACILPVSKNINIPLQYGTRHRAALGMSEKTDAYIIVVSEETGHISLARHSEIRNITVEELTEILRNELKN